MLVVTALRLLLEITAELGHVILLVVFGVIVAFILGPLADALQQRLRRRGLAVLATALIALATLGIGVSLLIVPLVRETRELATDVPRYMAILSSDEPIHILGIEVSGEVRQRVGAEIGARAAGWTQEAARIALRIGAVVVDFVFVLVLGIYLLASAPTTRAWLIARVPASRRAEVQRVQAEARRIFGGYVRGQLILGVIIGTVSGVAYALLGLPYAVFLGVLAGLLELVPIIGPIVAGAVAALVALTQPFPTVLWVIGAAILIQQLENNLLVPRISGGAVGLHPLAAFLAVLVGAEIAGIVGAIFAVPIAGLVWAIWRAEQTEAADPALTERATPSPRSSRGDSAS